MTKAVSIRGMSFCYGKAPVLQDVNLDINKGECLGIIGPNGGGKTTLLRLIMGLLKPHKGTLTILGKTPQQARTHIGYVPQARAFDTHFPITVLDLVLSGRLDKAHWPGFYGKVHAAAALAALDKVGLMGHEEKPFHALSGGQAQRALVARALASEPELLLLDEALSSADPEAQESLHQLLDTLRHQCTILMVTHDLHTAIHLVDRVALVQVQVSTYETQEVCEHFALGLYHHPLVKAEHPKP